MRIKFYSSNHWSSGTNLEKAEKLRVDNHTFGNDVNDMIEKYNIAKFFNPNISWTSDPVELRQWAARFKPEVFRWINTQVTNDTILDILQIIDVIYIDDFWELFENQKLYKKIDTTRIETHLSEGEPALHSIMRQKQTCLQYGDAIAAYLEANQLVTLLIAVHDKPSEYTLPRALTSEKIDQIFSSYVASGNPNPNMLTRIEQWKSEKPFIISDETKYAAKQRHDTYSEDYFRENTGNSVEIKIGFSDNQDELVVHEQAGLDGSISYSSKWITENLDCPTLLNNFIYMLEFVDAHQMRVSAVSKKSERSILELGGTDSNKYRYDTNSAFDYKQMLVTVQFQAYYEYLKRNGIVLENVITWFFNTYLQQEFNGLCISTQLSEEESSYWIKCSAIADIFDSISKQYHHYVRDGAIDLRFLEFSNSAVALDQVFSQVQGKYVYGMGRWIEGISHTLFSNQSILTYPNNHEFSHDSFIELISNEVVLLSDYEPYQLRLLEQLNEDGVIMTDESGKILILDINLVTILYDLYHNECISYYRYASDYQDAFQKLKDKKAIMFASTLLTKSEAEYFSYYLDDKHFSNGLKLRNKYSHGAVHIISDEDTHYRNYLIFLRLLILLVIKINDDCCLAEALKQQSQSEI